MQINSILVGLSSEYETFVVVVITTSRQSYDLVGVTSIFLYVESQQQVNVTQIGTNSVAFNVDTKNISSVGYVAQPTQANQQHQIT